MSVKEFWAPYVSYWKKALDFEGKTNRKDFWMVALANLLISTVSAILMTIPYIAYFVYVIDSLYGVAIILPSTAIGVRRLHDTNRSGLWLLLSFIPIVGAVILIIWFCEPSAFADTTQSANEQTSGTTIVVNSDSVNQNAKPADAEVINNQDNTTDISSPSNN